MKEHKVVFRKTTPEFKPSKGRFDALLVEHRKKMRKKFMLNIVILVIEVLLVTGITFYAMHQLSSLRKTTPAPPHTQPQTSGE